MKIPKKAAVRTPSEIFRKGSRSMPSDSDLLASFDWKAWRIARMRRAVMLPNGTISRGRATIATFAQGLLKDDVRLNEVVWLSMTEHIPQLAGCLRLCQSCCSPWTAGLAWSDAAWEFLLQTNRSFRSYCPYTWVLQSCPHLWFGEGRSSAGASFPAIAESFRRNANVSSSTASNSSN